MVGFIWPFPLFLFSSCSFDFASSLVFLINLGHSICLVEFERRGSEMNIIGYGMSSFPGQGEAKGGYVVFVEKVLGKCIGVEGFAFFGAKFLGVQGFNYDTDVS